jgi:hypothetical protein
MEQGNFRYPVPLPYQVESYTGGILRLRMTRSQWIFHSYLSIAPLFMLLFGVSWFWMGGLQYLEPWMQAILALFGLLIPFLALQLRVIRRIAISSAGIELQGHRWGFMPIAAHFAFQDEDRIEAVYRGGRSANVDFRLLRGGKVYPLFHVSGGVFGDAGESGRQMAVILEHFSGKQCSFA